MYLKSVLFFFIDYIKRTNLVDVFHIESGLWYLGTIAKVSDGGVMIVHYPHHESEKLVWKQGMQLDTVL